MFGITWHVRAERGAWDHAFLCFPAAQLKFTCNLCKAINVKPINPYAWTHGSVFGRCAGCGVVHKLTDNLKLFHELSGPVFSGFGRKAADVRLPKIVPQRPTGITVVGLGGLDE
jgi:DNL zinc finger